MKVGDRVRYIPREGLVGTISRRAKAGCGDWAVMWDNGKRSSAWECNLELLNGADCSQLASGRSPASGVKK
jgi:hypothetical protein